MSIKQKQISKKKKNVTVLNMQCTSNQLLAQQKKKKEQISTKAPQLCALPDPESPSDLFQHKILLCLVLLSFARDFQNAWNNSAVLSHQVADVVGDVLADDYYSNVATVAHGRESLLNFRKRCGRIDNEVIWWSCLLLLPIYGVSSLVRRHAVVANTGEKKSGYRILVADDADNALFAIAVADLGCHNCYQEAEKLIYELN